MRARGEALIHSGVDVIYGHSAHHVLPVERVGDGLILYGMGDFADDYSGVDNFRNDLAYVGRVALSPDSPPDLTIIPTRLVHDPTHSVVVLDPTDPDFALVMAATQWNL